MTLFSLNHQSLISRKNELLIQQKTNQDLINKLSNRETQ